MARKLSFVDKLLLSSTTVATILSMYRHGVYPLAVGICVTALVFVNINLWSSK